MTPLGEVSLSSFLGVGRLQLYEETMMICISGEAARHIWSSTTLYRARPPRPQIKTTITPLSSSSSSMILSEIELERELGPMLEQTSAWQAAVKSNYNYTVWLAVPAQAIANRFLSGF